MALYDIEVKVTVRVEVPDEPLVLGRSWSELEIARIVTECEMARLLFGPRYPLESDVFMEKDEVRVEAMGTHRVVAESEAPLESR